MANKSGDILQTTENSVYVIEIAAVTGKPNVWSPLPIQGTHHSRKLKNDPNRTLRLGLISMTDIMAYRILEHAQAAYTAVTAGAIANQFRIVKMEATIKKTFVSGAPM